MYLKNIKSDGKIGLLALPINGEAAQVDIVRFIAFTSSAIPYSSRNTEATAIATAIETGASRQRANRLDMLRIEVAQYIDSYSSTRESTKYVKPVYTLSLRSDAIILRKSSITSKKYKGSVLRMSPLACFLPAAQVGNLEESNATSFVLRGTTSTTLIRCFLSVSIVSSSALRSRELLAEALIILQRLLQASRKMPSSQTQKAIDISVSEMPPRRRTVLRSIIVDVSSRKAPRGRGRSMLPISVAVDSIVLVLVLVGRVSVSSLTSTVSLVSGSGVVVQQSAKVVNSITYQMLRKAITLAQGSQLFS